MPLIIPSNSITGGYEVDNSLRFDDGSSDYLNRTPASAGSTRLATFSFWVKRANLSGVNQYIYMVDDGTNQFGFHFGSDEKFKCFHYNGTSYDFELTTTSVYRDISAWYHIVIKIDTANATAIERLKLFVNNEYVAWNTTPSQNFDGIWLKDSTTHIGATTTPNNYFDGYLAEFVAIDGTALDPTSFGEFDEDTGIWKPINVSGLTFGTNGFYLDFEDSAALGDDVSGNGNDFTVNNLTSVDQTTDTPTNNYATLNPLYPVTTFSYSEGNLKGSSSSSAKGTARGTIGMQDSGKWFFEVKITSSDGSGVGISAEDMDANAWQPASGTFVIYTNNGDKVVNGTATSYGATYGDGDIIGVAYNSDDAEITFYKNGTTQGTITGVTTGTIMFPSISDTSTSGDAIFECNFGSPSFTISSGNSDENGYGNFEYAVPSGYYALNTKNLAEYG